jgi:hypothetical protein
VLYSCGTDNAENTVLLLRSADHTENKSRNSYLASSLAHCCLATSYKHSSYCCVRVSRGVYRAAAWHCVDMSQIWSFTTIGQGIHVILRLLLQQFEAAVLVLLMGEIYEVHRWDGFKWHNIHMTFNDDQFGHWSNIKVTASTIWEAAVLLMGGIYVVRHSGGFR